MTVLISILMWLLAAIAIIPVVLIVIAVQLAILRLCSIILTVGTYEYVPFKMWGRYLPEDDIPSEWKLILSLQNKMKNGEIFSDKEQDQIIDLRRMMEKFGAHL